MHFVLINFEHVNMLIYTSQSLFDHTFTNPDPWHIFHAQDISVR